MYFPFVVVTVLFAGITAISGLMKLQRNPRIVKVIHETVGVPMQYLNLLAICEFAGAAGLIAGLWYRPLGIAAGIGLVIYFVGAVVSHLRVGDVGGIGSAVFMLALAVAALALRSVTS